MARSSHRLGRWIVALSVLLSVIAVAPAAHAEPAGPDAVAAPDPYGMVVQGFGWTEQQAKDNAWARAYDRGYKPPDPAATTREDGSVQGVPTPEEQAAAASGTDWIPPNPPSPAMQVNSHFQKRYGASACDTAPPPGYGYYTRTRLCVTTWHTAIQFFTIGGKYVFGGSSIATYSDDLEFNNAKLTWMWRTTYTMKLSQIPSLAIQPGYACDGGCKQSTSASNYLVGKAGKYQFATYEMSSSMAKSTTALSSLLTNVYRQFTAYVSANGGQNFDRANNLFYFPTARCDNNLGQQNVSGCIVPAVEPVLVYGKTDQSVNEVAYHVYDSQTYAGSPGKFANGGPVGAPLTRTRVSELQTANSRAKDRACIKKYGNDGAAAYRAQGFECDEYPFASTNQGCACGSQKFSVRFVEGGINNTAGKVLQNFYRQNHVIDGDAFYVEITNNSFSGTRT